MLSYVLLFMSLCSSTICCTDLNCFKTPPGCFGSSCITQLNWSEYGTAFNFTIKVLASYFSISELENFWLGLGTSQLGSMESSQITLCTHSSSKDSVIQVSGYSHGVTPVAIGPSLTSQIEMMKTDTHLSCQFMLHKSLFYDETRFVFVGGGPVEDNLILYHFATPMVSIEKISFSKSGTKPSGYGVTDFRILLHASAMITGYGIFMVVGIYASRYIKPLFESSWYRIHTNIIFSMVFIIAVGICSIFLKKRSVTFGMHETVGFLIIFLTVFQIVLGSCRPYKKHEKRTIVSKTHLTVGIVLFILVILNIFLGLAKIQLKIPNHIFVIQGLYVIWIVFGSIVGNEALKYFYSNDQILYIKKLKLYTMINIGIILMYGCTIIILLNVVE